MSSNNDTKLASSSLPCPVKGNVVKVVGSNNSGVISVMKRPSSWPNLLSDYWFNATNSLESPLKIAAHQSPSSHHQTEMLVNVHGNDTKLNLDDAVEDAGTFEDDGIEDSDDEEDKDSKCVVVIGRGNCFMENESIMSREEVKQKFYDELDEIRFLDEDTQSVLLSPQLFSHSSILNPSLDGSREDSPNDIVGHVNNNRRAGGSKEPKPHFPIGDFDFLECQICLRKQWLYRRACCSFPACCNCLKEYFTTKIEQSIVTIECINNHCSSFIHRDEISTRLDSNMKNIYHRLLLSSNSNGLSKTCPQCNHLKTLDSMDQLKKMKKAAKKEPKASCVICDQCQYQWCFPCCSPWHEGIKCKQYIRGDLLLHFWAKQMNQGQFNAQKCPKCKVRV